MFDQEGSLKPIETPFDMQEHLSQNRIFLSKGIDVPVCETLTEFPNFIFSQIAKKRRVSPEQKVLGTLHRNYWRALDPFPDAKMIHLVRDPRHVANSCLKMGVTGTHFGGGLVWANAMKDWDKTREKLSTDQHLEVRYEDLLADVEGTLGKIFSFIGEKFEPEVLNFHQESTYDPIDSTIKDWSKIVSKSQAKKIEFSCFPWMERYEYLPSHDVKENFAKASLAYWSLENKLFSLYSRCKLLGPKLFIFEIISRKLVLRSWHRSITSEISKRISLLLK